MAEAQAHAEAVKARREAGQDAPGEMTEAHLAVSRALLDEIKLSQAARYQVPQPRPHLTLIEGGE